MSNDLENLDDVVIHYGVKGMKWGVRRSQAALDRAAGRRQSADARTARQNQARPVSELSNKELKALNERLQLEANNARLNPGVVDRGQKLFKNTLGLAITGVTVYNLVNSPAGKSLINQIKKVMNRNLKQLGR